MCAGQEGVCTCVQSRVCVAEGQGVVERVCVRACVEGVRTRGQGGACVAGGQGDVERVCVRGVRVGVGGVGGVAKRRVGVCICCLAFRSRVAP